MTKLTHSVEIQKSQREVYRLASQVEKYPEFLPGYLESRILQRRGNEALIERAAQLGERIVRWKSWVRWQEPDALFFIQEEGPLKGMRVDWRFEALASERTRVTITHVFSVTRPLGIGRIMEKMVFKPQINEIAGRVIEAFKFACEKQVEVLA